ncbi:MAG: winged helix-turn-helix domain-containing protein [Thermoanaerobaculia bacterium]|nr:winged helix-turn-helix domain-containing protein [Thermoanaerobaculia bacterium]
MIYRFGRFELNAARYELTRDRQPISVEPRVFEVLAYLIAHRDRVVAKDELLDELWKSLEVSESALTRTIKKARALLGDPTWIKAVYGRGYKFEGAVEELGEADPEPSQLESVHLEPNSRSLPATMTGRWNPRSIVLLAIALVAALWLMIWWQDRAGEHPATSNRVRSIAVLPLLDLSEGDREDYFALGLTEALITRLANIGELRVISRTSVMNYRASPRSLPQIARELNVEAVLEGSVMRVGQQVRVNVQLIRAATDEHLWAQEYERDLGDILLLQTEIAHAVANAVELRLTAGESSRLSLAQQVNIEAYKRYLLGRFHMNRRTVADLEEAIVHLTEAIRLDPEYAPAHATLADTYILLSTYYALAPAKAFPKARESAESALALDPFLSEAHASLAMVSLALRWDFVSAEAGYRRAIELAPGNASAHQWYGELLSVLGRHDEAVAEGQRAWELDPLSPIINAALGQRLNAAGRWQEALEQFAATIELDPGLPWIHREMALAYSHLGQKQQCLGERVVEMKMRGIESQRIAELEEIAASEDMTGFWQWELDRLHRSAQATYVPEMLYAEGLNGIGDRERALIALAEGIEQRGEHILLLTTSPELEELTRDPAARPYLVDSGLAHMADPSRRAPG